MLKKILLTFLIVMFASIPAYAEKIETASPVLTGTWDFGGGELEIPNSTTLPATCNIGESYMDTNATTGQRLYLCESANTWALQGDGGAAGSAFSGITGSTNTTAAMVVGTGASLTTSGSGTIVATTSTALVANGANCSAGSGALGVDASGASESCTDFEEDLSNSAGLLAALSDETGTGVAVFGTSPTFTTSIITPLVTLSGTGTIDGLDAIDATGEATLEATLDIAGDVSSTGMATTVIGSDKILESMLKAVDAAVDEECLTKEDTTGDFEWQACGGTDTNAVAEICFTAAAMLPLDAADSIPPLTTTAGTNVDIITASYDDGTDECRQVHLKVPSDVQGGSTITFRNVWHSATATTGDVIWDTRYQSTGAEGETWDAALTTKAATADTAQGTVKLRTVTTVTETLVNLGWAANDDVYIQVCRDANAAGDTLVGDAQLQMYCVEIPRA